ncbi:MAG: response regulator transcription factor [Clostridia bacterium]|nr:response regulator transcription factor [Clostridia bacterium]MBN2883223.1 response regulator transcription factor [Clostridia bacterium]
MAKIMVVDDERELREVVSLYLEKEGYKVLQAGDGVSAVKVFHDEKPDLVILDLMLPDIPGEKVCNAIRENHNTPIIMLTSKSGEDSRINGLEMGADDYITKPFSPKELVARVKAIFRRMGKTSSIDLHATRKLEIDENSYTVKKDGRQIDLTPIEFKILSTMYRNPGRTYTREQLITYALGYEYEGMSRTIDSHIKNIRQKIESDPSRPEYVRTVFGIGYKFMEEQ